MSSVTLQITTRFEAPKKQKTKIIYRDGAAGAKLRKFLGELLVENLQKQVIENFDRLLEHSIYLPSESLRASHRTRSRGQSSSTPGKLCAAQRKPGGFLQTASDRLCSCFMQFCIKGQHTWVQFLSRESRAETQWVAEVKHQCVVSFGTWIINT